MAIKVKHGSGASLAALAYRGGVAAGNRQRQVEDRSYGLQVANLRENARQSDARLAQQDEQFNTELDARSRESEADRQFRLNASDRANEQAIQRMRVGQEIRQQDEIFAQGVYQNKVKFDYTAQQKAEFDSLAAALHQVETSDEYSDEEKADFRRQIHGKMLGFKPLPKINEPSPYPEGMDIGETWLSDDGQYHMTRDDKGNVKKIAEVKGGITNKDVNDAYATAYKALTVEGPDGAVAPSIADVEAYVESMLGMKDRLKAKSKGAEDGNAAAEAERQQRGPAESAPVPPARQPSPPIGDAATPPVQPVTPGNIDLNARPVMQNGDGTISTEQSISVGIDGKEVLIPTVSADGRRILSEKDAIQQYKRTGKHLGKFNSPEEADAYAQWLHEQQAQRYGGSTSPDAIAQEMTANMTAAVDAYGKNPTPANKAKMDAAVEAQQAAMDELKGGTDAPTTGEPPPDPQARFKAYSGKLQQALADPKLIAPDRKPAALEAMRQATAIMQDQNATPEQQAAAQEVFRRLSTITGVQY